MLGWDGLIALLVLIDAVRLPRPERFTVTRTFVDSPQLGQPTRIELAVRYEPDAVRNSVIDVRMVDDLHPSLVAVPAVQRVEAFPREDAVSTSTIYARERGDFALGRVYLRYRGAFRLIERWAVAEPVVAATNDENTARQQRVRVFPARAADRDAEAQAAAARRGARVREPARLSARR
jgi:uncharacterized protein (DUF58 family)